MRTLRLAIANLLCRLAAAVAGQGVDVQVRIMEPEELCTPIYRTPGSVRVVYE